MANRLLFSIIIPTYNRANLLPRAVKSVLNQTYSNFELIIVDDGSEDNTPKVVDSFQDEKIRYYRHEKNKGVTKAGYTGRKLAKGEYTAILGDDDELLPKALEKIVKKLNDFPDENLDCLIFNIKDYETGRLLGSGFKKDRTITLSDWLCQRLLGDYFMIKSKRLSKEQLKKKNKNLNENQKIWTAKMFERFNAHYFNETLYLAHREHGETWSSFRKKVRKMDKVVANKKSLLSEYGDKIKNNCPSIYGRNLMILGFHQLLINEKSEGRENLVNSLRFNLFLGAMILFILSFFMNGNHLTKLYSKFLKIESFLQSLLARQSTEPVLKW